MPETHGGASEKACEPAVCPNGHAMDDGLFHCPACGAYRPSANADESEHLPLLPPYAWVALDFDEALDALGGPDAS